eukprot:6457159-Amphidinium_carterae.2
MQKSLLHYRRTVPKAVPLVGEEELARRSASKQAELAPAKNGQLEGQESVKALQNDSDCLAGLTCKLQGRASLVASWRPTAALTEEEHAVLDAEGDDPIVLEHAEGETDDPKKKRTKIHAPRNSQVWFLKLVENFAVVALSAFQARPGCTTTLPMEMIT